MKRWLQRLRGAIGMGLTWMIGWAPVGVVYGLVMTALADGLVGPIGGMFLGVKLFGGVGFIAGGLFSLVLGLAEGRKRFDQLRPASFTAYGAIGGMLLGVLASLNGAGGPGFDGEDVFVMALTTLLGAGSARTTLAIAAASVMPELQAGRDEVEAAGLSDPEKHELLGSR